MGPCRHPDFQLAQHLWGVAVLPVSRELASTVGLVGGRVREVALLFPPRSGKVHPKRGGNPACQRAAFCLLPPQHLASLSSPGGCSPGQAGGGAGAVRPVLGQKGLFAREARALPLPCGHSSSVHVSSSRGRMEVGVAGAFWGTRLGFPGGGRFP